MTNRILIGALLLFFILTPLTIWEIATLHDTIQSNEVALERVDKQIMELQYHVIYLEESLVNVVITSETNEYRLDLIEEIFD
jgi:nitrate reductase NapAB chaperone NapD|tara:strand:+ start:8403 stop:8648 length:246 start_codon:yes stop_codon:yes gene_type:complete